MKGFDFHNLFQSKRQALLIGSCLLPLFLAIGVDGYFRYRDGLTNLKAGFYGYAYNSYYQKAVEGMPSAQTVIGNLYLLGLGVKEDRYEAARWYLKAALKGHIPAQLNLGQLYYNGLGVPRRVDNAVGWFHLAMEAGSERAEGHIKYIGGTNTILPLMFDQAVLKFENLKKVNERFEAVGETVFLNE